MENQSHPSRQKGKKEWLKRWGIFIAAAGCLCLFQEWLWLPEWVGIGIFFAYSLLFAPDYSSPPKKLPQGLVKFFIGAVLAIIAALSLAGISLISGIKAGYVMFLILFATGCGLIVWSAIIPSQPETTSDHTDGNTETGKDTSVRAKSVVKTLIERIRQI